MSNLSDHIFSATNGVLIGTAVAVGFKPLTAMGAGAVTVGALFNPLVNIIETIASEAPQVEPVTEQAIDSKAQGNVISIDECIKYSAENNTIYVCPKLSN